MKITKVQNIVSQEEMDEFVQKNGYRLAIVNYYTQRAEIRDSITLFEDLSKKYPKLAFARVDADNYDEMAEKDKVDNLPTLIYYKQGKRICTVEGIEIDQVDRKIAELREIDVTNFVEEKVEKILTRAEQIE